MKKDSRALYRIQQLAGNAGIFRMNEQDDEVTAGTLEGFIQGYYKNSSVEVDDRRGVINVSVQAERTIVDVGDMKKSQDYMNRVLQEYQARGGERIEGDAQFVGIKANDQFSVYLVFQVTDNPTKF